MSKGIVSYFLTVNVAAVFDRCMLKKSPDFMMMLCYLNTLTRVYPIILTAIIFMECVGRLFVLDALLDTS